MLQFIVRRLIIGAVTVVLLSLVVFAVLRIAPGDDVVCPGFCSPEQIAALRQERGLDKPLFPVSANVSADQDWWMLAVPAVGGAFALGALYGRRSAGRQPARG
jgi:hypothetical protein